MELGAVRRMRQSAVTAPAVKAGTSKAAAARPRTDQVALSHQAASLLLAQQQARAQRKAEQKDKNWWQLDLIQREESGSSSDGTAQAMKNQQTCQKIAARIMAGDRVPPEDLKYLMENDMQSYQLAMALRHVKERPKEWESALEKEEQSSGSSGSGGVSSAGGSAAPEAAVASDGGSSVE